MTYRKSADPKITLKATLTYPIRYTVQTLPAHFIDVQGDKNTPANKNIWTFGQLFPRPRITPKGFIGYLFK